MTLHLRAATKPEQLLAATQQEIRALDPKLPVYNVKTLEQYRRDALSDTRIQTVLIVGFGLLALALASLGLYGVLSFSVGRTRTGRSAFGWRSAQTGAMCYGWSSGRDLS